MKLHGLTFSLNAKHALTHTHTPHTPSHTTHYTRTTHTHTTHTHTHTTRTTPYARPPPRPGGAISRVCEAGSQERRAILVLASPQSAPVKDRALWLCEAVPSLRRTTRAYERAVGVFRCRPRAGACRSERARARAGRGGLPTEKPGPRAEVTRHIFELFDVSSDGLLSPEGWILLSPEGWISATMVVEEAAGAHPSCASESVDAQSQSATITGCERRFSAVFCCDLCDGRRWKETFARVFGDSRPGDPGHRRPTYPYLRRPALAGDYGHRPTYGHRVLSALVYFSYFVFTTF